MAEDIGTVKNYRQQGLAMWREYMTYILDRDFYMINNENKNSK